MTAPDATPARTCGFCGADEADHVVLQCINNLRADREALAEQVRALEGVFESVEQITITRNHPEFGRECTVIIDDGERYASVIHQPDDWTAVRMAKAEALAIRATPTTEAK